MGHWAGIVSAEQFTDEGLYARATCVVATGPALDWPDVAAGDPIALVAGTHPPVLFGLGSVVDWLPGDDRGGRLAVAYQRRLFDRPVDVGWERTEPGLVTLTAEQYAELAAEVGPPVAAARREWLVSVAIPVEAATEAEAVREYWSFVERLGPRELPAYVWPPDDELALHAYLLGAETNLDPEVD